MLLSRQFARPACRCGARIGHKVWTASESPQVTGLALRWPKIVRVFEFMPLTSAPGRIRTYAHGSGGRCSLP
jgi:hypothetical protein